MNTHRLSALLICLIGMLTEGVLSCILDQPAVTYGNKTGYVTFSFVTANPGCTTAPSVVLYNTVTGVSTNLVAQNTKSYQATLDGQLYNKTAYFFSVKLTLGQRYAWIGKAGNSIGPYYFTLRDYAKTMETRLAMISDADISTVSAPTFAALKRLDWSLYDGFLHGGDFAYNVENDGGARGDNYFNNITGIITQTPYLVIAGNHENYDNAKLFNYRFRMPNVNDDYSNNFYFKVVNSVLFGFLNYDYFLKIHTKRFQEVFDYVSAQLDLYSRDTTIRWRVIVTHRPIYCGNMNKTDCSVNFYYLKPLEDLFLKHGIDVYLESHVHIYERLRFMQNFNFIDYPVKKVGNTYEFTNVKQPLTVICGLGGTVEELKSNVSTANINYATSSGTVAYLDIRITETSFQIDLIGAASGSVMDSVRLIKTKQSLQSPSSSPVPVDRVDSRPSSSVGVSSPLMIIALLTMIGLLGLLGYRLLIASPSSQSKGDISPPMQDSNIIDI